jgi:DNA-binding SARP family transcriptional activator
LSVEIDGVQVAGALRGQQVPLLFAYLVLGRGRSIGRDELIEATWPEQRPRSEDAALRTLLSRLRSALGPSILSGREGLSLSLPEPAWIDVEAAARGVDRARAALERGDARGAWALAQVPLNIAGRGLLPGAHAPWLEAHRTELHDLLLRALEVIGAAGLRLGGSQLASAERAARSLIDAEPYRESGYALLMQALAAQGNLAEALRSFERLRTLLMDELGTVPSRETLAQHAKLLQAGDVAPPAGPRQEAAAIELPAELRARAVGPILGRDDELAQLDRLWSPDPVSEVVLLAGEPGIGKTRLAAETSRRAHDSGAIVLGGRSAEETLAPYEPFLQALQHYVASAPIERLRVQAREHGAEVSRLVPELRRRAPDLPLPAEGDPATERYRLFEAIAGLLAELSAGAPVLLVLDDLHLADKPTLLLLVHLARAPATARVRILGTYRSTEAAAGAFAEALGQLRAERLVTELELTGLSEPETAALVEVLTSERGTPAFVQALHAETEGNPFFIEEIVRQLSQSGIAPGMAGAVDLQRLRLPDGIKRVIARRLSGLDGAAREWLRAAAVIGRDFDISLLERVVGLDEDTFLDALDEALSAGVVTSAPEGEHRYSFSHALISETLYEGMSEPRRARIHRRLGEVLAESGDAEENLGTLAWHLIRGATRDDYARAVEYAARAGARADSVLAYEEAADHYLRAVEVLGRFDPGSRERRLELLLELGEARIRGGEREASRRAFRSAAELAEALGDAAGFARAAIGASRPYIQSPGVVDDELIAMLERAVTMLEGEPSPVLIRIYARLCGALYYSPQRERMKELSARATAIAEQLGDPESRAYACAARRRSLWEPGLLPERLAASTEMLTLARKIGNAELALQAHALLLVDLLESGDVDGVDAQFEAFDDGASRLRQSVYMWNAVMFRAMRALLAGQLEEADELSSRAVALGVRAEAITSTQYYAIQQLAIRREQGRMAELEPAARRLAEEFPERPAYRVALATLLWETGRLEQAGAEVERVAFDDIPVDLDWLTSITLLSDLCAELCDAPRSERLYELLLPYRDVNVVIGLGAACQGAAARYLGRLAAAVGRREEAAEHFEQALAANTALRAPVCLARTQLDYARLLGARSPRRQALIDEAAATAEKLGLVAVARIAESIRPF